MGATLTPAAPPTPPAPAGHEAEQPSGATTLDDWLVAEFLASYRGHTRSAYTRDLADYRSWCEQRSLPLLAATRVDAAGYLDHLIVRGLAPATITRRLVTLRGLYSLAIEERLIHTSPVGRLKPPPRRPTPARTLTRPQLHALLAAADHQPDTRLAALAWLLAGTGLRISEGCGARIENLHHDPAGQPWLAATCKGGHHRKLPLHPAVWARVETAAGARRTGPILTTRTGHPLDRNNATKQLRALAAAAGIHGSFSPHTLRHTFVTLARQSGCPLEEIQDAVGHADPRTTRRYDHAALPAWRHPAHQILPTPPAGDANGRQEDR